MGTSSPDSWGLAVNTKHTGQLLSILVYSNLLQDKHAGLMSLLKIIIYLSQGPCFVREHIFDLAKLLIKGGGTSLCWYVLCCIKHLPGQGESDQE